MDFSDKELKVLLQALYRFRGEVSGASQSEQNKLGLVSSVIGKIEDKVGPAKAERTSFDVEMARSLAVLSTGRAGAARKDAELDKAAASPKVKKASPAKAAAKAKKSGGAGAASGTRGARTAKAPGRKAAGSGKTKP
jgi:hypothetical protein